MSLAKHLDKEKLNEYLVWQLREYNGKYGLTKNNDAEVNVQLADLIKRAYEQTGRQVVVLMTSMTRSCWMCFMRKRISPYFVM